MDVLDFGSESIEKDLDKFKKSGPAWLKLQMLGQGEGESKRIMFIGNELPIQWLYQVRHLTQVDNKGKPKYVGAFRSLTHEKNKISGQDIRAMVQGGDFSKAEIDVKVLKAPTFQQNPNVQFVAESAVLALVYPTDKNGNINKDYFSKGVFDLAWVKLTDARLREVLKFANRARAEGGPNIFQTDFLITRENKGDFEVWKWDQRPESVYLKNKHLGGLEKALEQKVRESLAELKIAKIRDVANFIGQSLTEGEWASMLTKAGYDLREYGIDAKVPQVPVSNEDVPANPEMEGGLDLGGGEFKY